MKITAIAALLLVETVFAAPAIDKRQTIFDAFAKDGRGVLGALCNKPFGRSAAKGSNSVAATAKLETKSTLSVEGVTVRQIKVRTGPYVAPGMDRTNLCSGHKGMLESYYDMDVEKPCSDCNILRQVGGLEYSDGTNANIDSGLWLHHMVHFNAGPRRWDPVGITHKGCLPFDGLAAAPAYTTANKPKPAGVSARTAERFFVTGNERTPFNFFSDPKKPSAYHLDAADKFFYLVELMNMNMHNSTVYITMTYDVTDGPLPPGWDDVKTVFLDADSCGTSEIDSPPGQQPFNINSTKNIYKPNIEGRIVDSIGHLHDGGIKIDIMSGTNAPLCNSDAIYSSKPEYVYRDMGMPMGGDKVAKDHISNMNGCGMKDINVRSMDSSQSWSVTGHYDYTKHDPNLEKNKPSEIMAIAIVLAAVKPGQYNKAP